MNCNEFTDRLGEYLEEQLSAAERDLMTAHARICPNCGQELEQMASLHKRLLRDGQATGSVGLGTQVLEEIRRRNPLSEQHQFWRIIMNHKIASLSVFAAACIAVAVTITFVFAQTSHTQTVQSAPPATQPVVRGGAGARTLAQRVTRAQAIVRGAVQQVGEANSNEPGAMVDVRFRIVRVLYGTSPRRFATISVPVVASIVAGSPEYFASGKEHILFLDQVREENGQLVARELSAYYDSRPGRLDETEKQILEITAALGR